MKRRHENIKPTYDLVAKKIFQDTEITLQFVKDILDIEAKKVTILDGHQIHLKEDEDEYIFCTSVDVLAELEDKTQIIIEIQLAKQIFFINRLWAYICSQVSTNVENERKNRKTHEIYRHIMPVYAVAIVEENYFEDEKAFRTFSIRDDKTKEELKIKTRGQEERNLFKIAFIELKKYKEDEKEEYKKIRWIEFFGNKPFSKEKDSIIERAEKMLDVKKWSEEEKKMYNERIRREDAYWATIGYARQEGEDKGRSEGISIGRSEGISIGRSEGMILTYIALVKDGLLTIKEASKRLEITEEEFQKYLER